MGKLYYTAKTGAENLVRVGVLMPHNKELVSVPISADPNHPTDLPPGKYVLHWALWGNPGDSVAFELHEAPPSTKVLLETPTYKVPAGKFVVGSDGNARPAGYKDLTFTVV
jgi:hypothetical protein